MVDTLSLTPESLVNDLRRMGKQFAPGFICAPTWVKLRTKGSEERLDWGFDLERPSDRIDRDKDQWKLVRAPRDLLQRFLELADAPAEQIEAFARRYGVLGISKDHGFPISLEFPSIPLGFYLEHNEPLAPWRELSHRLGVVSRIARELRAGKLGADSDWWTLYPQFEKNRPFSTIWVDEKARNWRAQKQRKALVLARGWFQEEVDNLLKLGDVRLRLEWQPARWVVRVGYGHWLNLFGTLVVQLLLELCASEDVYICSGCGKSYGREGKRPNSKEHNWCVACRDADRPLREADQRRREKMREARRLSLRGVTPEKIAERLSTKPENVRRWLKPRKRVRKS